MEITDDKVFLQDRIRHWQNQEGRSSFPRLPKINALKNQRDKEIMLNPDFSRVNAEIDQLIEIVLDATKNSEN